MCAVAAVKRKQEGPGPHQGEAKHSVPHGISSARTDIRSAREAEPPAAKKAKVEDLFQITREQEQAFCTIYNALVKTEGGVLVAEGAIALFGKRKILTPESEKVKDKVHPLAFLKFLLTHPNEQNILRVLSQARWSMSMIISSPWSDTCDEFSKNMAQHKKAGTLQLEAFLEDLPEEARAIVRRHVERNEFTELLRFVIHLER